MNPDAIDRVLRKHAVFLLRTDNVLYHSLLGAGKLQEV